MALEAFKPSRHRKRSGSQIETFACFFDFAEQFMEVLRDVN